MGRTPIHYQKELNRIREMNTGQVLIFVVEHPWGLYKKIIDMLDDWLIREYYRVHVSKDEYVKVTKFSVPIFVDEEEIYDE